MNRFEKFLGKEKRIEIGGLTFIIKPLKVKDFNLIIDFQDRTTQAKAVKIILERITKDSFQDLSEEEIASVQEWPLEKVNPILEAFAEVNSLESGTKTEFLEKIKKAQEK